MTLRHMGGRPSAQMAQFCCFGTLLRDGLVSGKTKEFASADPPRTLPVHPITLLCGWSCAVGPTVGAACSAASDCGRFFFGKFLEFFWDFFFFSFWKFFGNFWKFPKQRTWFWSSCPCDHTAPCSLRTPTEAAKKLRNMNRTTSSAIGSWWATGAFRL